MGRGVGSGELLLGRNTFLHKMPLLQSFHCSKSLPFYPTLPPQNRTLGLLLPPIRPL